MRHTCLICGWPELQAPPRNKEGVASFEICPCCGFEFGFDDDDQGVTYEQARRRWFAHGMTWWSKSRPAPNGWNPSLQLARAGLK
jgi:hypothetical protein